MHIRMITLDISSEYIKRTTK